MTIPNCRLGTDIISIHNSIFLFKYRGMMRKSMASSIHQWVQFGEVMRHKGKKRKGY